jgi:hypothetical protein
MPNANGNDGGQSQDAEKDFERDREKSAKNKQSSKGIRQSSHVILTTLTFLQQKTSHMCLANFLK